MEMDYSIHDAKFGREWMIVVPHSAEAAFTKIISKGLDADDGDCVVVGYVGYSAVHISIGFELVSRVLWNDRP